MSFSYFPLAFSPDVVSTISPRVDIGDGSSSNRIALSIAAGLRCM